MSARDANVRLMKEIMKECAVFAKKVYTILSEHDEGTSIALHGLYLHTPPLAWLYVAKRSEKAILSPYIRPYRRVVSGPIALESPRCGRNDPLHSTRVPYMT